jgi:uncharacterized protein (TIGR03437 family)
MYSFPASTKTCTICLVVLAVALLMNAATQLAIAAHDISSIPTTGPVSLASANIGSHDWPDSAAAPQISGVINAASFTTTLAPGSLAAIVGTNFTTEAPAGASSTPLSTTLDGVSVEVGGIIAPLLYVSSTQINFQVPFEVPAGSPANVVVISHGAASSPFSVAIADYAVGLFTYDERDPVIVHATTSALVSPSDPAMPNETVLVYGTGIGKLSERPRTGYASGDAIAIDTPTITVGGAPAHVRFAGLARGLVGTAQFNIQLPAAIDSGTLPLVITFPGDTSAVANLEVAGTASGPELNLSTSHLDFGAVDVGKSEDVSLKLSNKGSAALTIHSLKISGQGFTLESAAGPFTIPAGKTQTTEVRSAPAKVNSESGTLTIASNDPSRSSVQVPLEATGITETNGPYPLPDNTMGLFLARAAAGGVDYIESGNVYSNEFLFSMVMPGTEQWIGLDKEISESYAPFVMDVFGQDSQVYEVLRWNEFSQSATCDFTRFDPATGGLQNGPRLSSGCDVSHLAFVGESIYWRVPATWDPDHLCYCIGGQFQVTTSGKTSTLLSRTDPDNQATIDVADSGTLYAIYYNAQNSTLAVWTRNLTTGHLDTLVRNYSINSGFKGFSFRLNDSILYAALTEISDNTFEIWTTDLTVPLASATPMQLSRSYPASSGSFNTRMWNVNHGKVAIEYSSTSMTSGIAVLDLENSGAVEAYDMSNIQILDFVPLWIPKP